MPVEHCHHVKENGYYCQQPALRGRRHCRAHLRMLGRRMRMARERARQLSRPLVLPPLEDMDSVMVALLQVLDARADHRITETTAGLMLYGLQQAACNLKWMEEQAAREEGKERGERAEEYPGFEAEFGLPEGFDLEQPPEVAFPLPEPPPPEAPEFSPCRNLELSWERFTPEDVELEELYDTGHVEEYKRRFGEVMAKSDRDRDEHKREVAKARWVLEADRRNREIALGRPIDRCAPKPPVETAQGKTTSAPSPQSAPTEATRPLQPSGTAGPHNGVAEDPAKTAAPAPAYQEGVTTRDTGDGKKPPKDAASRLRADHAGQGQK